MRYDTIIMNKKITVIILIIIVIITLIAVGMALFNNNQKKTILEPVIEMTDEALRPIPYSEEMKTYTDPAGFSFQHPSTVMVSPKKISDSAVYADIELTSNNQQGNITIVIRDTTITTTKNWMTSEGFKPPVDQIKEIPLGGLNGTQFMKGNQVITGLVDQKILFTITVNPQNNDEFWKKINDAIISSFAFAEEKQTTQSPKQNSSESSGNVSDEIENEVEEIVE